MLQRISKKKKEKEKGKEEKWEKRKERRKANNIKQSSIFVTRRYILSEFLEKKKHHPKTF